MTYQKAMEFRATCAALAEINEQLELLDRLYHLIEDKNAEQRRRYNREYNRLQLQALTYTNQCDLFKSWLSKIPDRVMQAYMCMRFVDGMTWAQIGARFGKKAPTIRKAVQRYLEKEAVRERGN